MKILQVYKTYFPDPPGGLQEAIRQICLATQPHGVKNCIFTLSPNPKPELLTLPEGEVVRHKSWAAPASCDLGGLSALLSFRNLSSTANAVLYHFPWPFADLLRFIADRSKPSLLLYHSDIVRQRWLGAIYAPLMWKTLHSMSAIIATSPAYARTSPVLSHPSIREKVRVIPLGIDENSYPKEGDMEILTRFGLGCGEPFFLFIGVLRYYKGLHFLVAAAKNLGARVVIAGSGPEGDRLKEVAVELGADNVIFTGRVTDAEKVALLQHCLAFVLPSHLRSEAFGMVLVEASMFGKPMITCEIGTGTSYVNAHKETGFVVPPESPSALADAMKTLLVDEELTCSMGLAARQRYEALFSGPALGKAYFELLESIR